MTSDKLCKSVILLFIPLTLILSSCKDQTDKELDIQAAKADSLSIKFNSPELKAVNAALLKDPGNAALYKKRAQIYMDIRQPEEAVFDAKRAIRLDSINPDYYLSLVDIYFSQNKTREAKELLESTEKKFPENLDALLRMAELYYLVKKYQKGLDYVNKALKLDENSARAYYIKGTIYKESGDTARAVSSFETATDQDNKFADAFYDLGVIYAARRNPLAMEYYNNALRINPTSTEMLYGRAKLLQDIGKTDEAITEYEAILKKDQACDRCLYNLGALYLEVKKDTGKAIDYFSRSISVNPGFADAYFARGYAWSKLNDKKRAQADYETCLTLDPSHDGASRGLNSL